MHRYEKYSIMVKCATPMHCYYKIYRILYRIRINLSELDLFEFGLGGKKPYNIWK